DTTTDETEHMPKDIIVGSQLSFRYSQNATKLPIDLLVNSAGEGKRQWRGDAVITLGDIAVVPEIVNAFRIGHLSQGCDRPRLQQVQFALFHRPFDVLGPAKPASRLPYQVRHGPNLLIIQ